MKVLIIGDYENYGGVATASGVLQQCLIESDYATERYSIYDKQYGIFGKSVRLVKAFFYLCFARFDCVVLMHFDATLVGLLARLFRIRKRFIYVLHTDIYGYFCHVSVSKRLVLRPLFWTLKKKTVVFVSKEAELKARQHLGFKNTTTIYNALDPNLRVAFADGKKLDRPFVFGSVARLHPGKNIDVLIRVFNGFWQSRQDVRLLVFGSGPELERLQAYAAHYACNDAIEFKGYVQDPNEIYSQIDGLVSFSSMEGFGLAILEALIRNVPVLHSDCSCGPREILLPNSNPCKKTSSYELANGGILVVPPVNPHPYSCQPQATDEVLLKVFNVFYENRDKVRRNSNVGLSSFDVQSHKNRWVKLLQAMQHENELRN